MIEEIGQGQFKSFAQNLIFNFFLKLYYPGFFFIWFFFVYVGYKLIFKISYESVKKKVKLHSNYHDSS